MGHPSGSDGFSLRGPDEYLDGPSAIVGKNARAWAGQAENPPKPRMGIRLDCSQKDASLRDVAFTFAGTRVSSLLSRDLSAENVPARALPGGKSAPGLVGTFGWLLYS